MINPERYIGKVVLFRNGEQLPTNFYMQYRNGRLSFVAETEMPPRRGKKVVSSADRLADLVHRHHQNMEASAARL